MGRPPKDRTPEQTSNLPWKEAINRVLSRAGGALHYTEIAERIVSEGLRHSVGATPASTVSVYLGEALREESSPYLKVGRGIYALKEVAEKNVQEASEAAESADQVAETGALRAFGMYWRREMVFWSSTPKLLGRQGTGATDVNFANQIGVYLLHDRDRAIYVGRAVDTLFGRLKAHTTDRLGGRWDRFSWFGLRGVDENGNLSDSKVPWNEDVVVETMEALLIESLEPPLNRRRGDNLSGIEYIQGTDPQVEAGGKKALLDDVRRSLGL